MGIAFSGLLPQVENQWAWFVKLCKRVGVHSVQDARTYDREHINYCITIATQMKEVQVDGD